MANEDRSNQGSQGGTENRGFASMDPEKQREIASKGGKASQGGSRESGSSGDNR